MKRKPYEELTESEKRQRDISRRTTDERRKRERVWEASKPGLNIYTNPDLQKFIEQFKKDDPEFAAFLNDIKTKPHEDIDREIRELADQFAKELQES